MAQNDFLTFATGAGANVESQAAYAADPARLAGEQAGKANSARSNKVWRQASMWATALGLWLNDHGHDAIDDGNPATLKTAFDGAVGSAVASVASDVPGIIKLTASGVIPTGYLDCDGSLVSRATYAALFTALGTTYGAGNGSTTFAIPDLRGRAPIGVGTGNALSARSLGQSGGEETHQLITQELPSHVHPVNITSALQSADHIHTGTTNTENQAHTHNVSDPGHAHVFGTTPLAASGGGGSVVGGGTDAGTSANTTGISLSNETVAHNHNFATGGVSANHTHSVQGSTDGTGGGLAHNNMMPFLVLHYIIKT